MRYTLHIVCDKIIWLRRFRYCRASSLFVVIVCLDALLLRFPWNKFMTGCSYHYVSYIVVCVVYLYVRCVGNYFIFIEIDFYFLFMVFALQILNIAEKYILKKKRLFS